MDTTKQRLLLLRQYGHLYKRHLDAGADGCFYCGDTRTCLDHRPALSSLDQLTPQGFRDAGIPLVLLPSCADCNKNLGSRPLHTAAEALAYLTNAIEKLYHRRATLWSADEIAEMSPMFQTIIKARKAQLSVMHARLRFMQERALDVHLFPVYLDPDDDI